MLASAAPRRGSSSGRIAGDMHHLVAALAPPTIARSRRGRPHSFARSRNSASLARLSTGGAVTDALRHRRAVGEAGDAVEPVGPAARRQPHRDPHAARRRRERQVEASEEGRGNIVSDQALRKYRIRIRMIGEMSMPPKLGRKARIGRSAGSVTR